MNRTERRRREREGLPPALPPRMLRPAPKPPVPNAVLSIPAWRSAQMPHVRSLLDVVLTRRYEFFLKYNDALIPRSRNVISSMFLTQYPTVDVLVMIDTDMEFDIRALDALVALAREKKAVAGGVVAIRGKNTWASVRTFEGKPLSTGPDTDPQEVRYIGGAFMAIHRDVFETLKPQVDYCPSLVTGFETDYWGFFDCMNVDYKGLGKEPLSEDFAFCERVQRAGLGVWALTNHQLGHVGTYTYHVGVEEAIDAS